MSFFQVDNVWKLDDQQLMLAHWVGIYASVYELPRKDRPSEEIMENDEAFDRWMDNFGADEKSGYTDDQVNTYHAREKL